MEPWYKVVQPRAEVREGRSFNPDEFAIALEQVAAGTAPEDYTDPNKFFARTCLTQALREHVAMVLRRLNGEIVNAPPVLSLITQFGGGETDTPALYFLKVAHPALRADPSARSGEALVAGRGCQDPIAIGRDARPRRNSDPL